jgi:hypothetical protein
MINSEYKISFQPCCLFAILCTVNVKIQVWVCVSWNARDEGVLIINGCLVLVGLYVTTMCNKVSELFGSFGKYAMLQISMKLTVVDWVSLVINIIFLTVFVSMVFCVYSCSAIVHEGIVCLLGMILLVSWLTALLRA